MRVSIGGPLNLDLSSSAAAANAEPDGDIVIETVRARDTKLQDRRQWLPAAVHRSGTNPYQSNGLFGLCCSIVNYCTSDALSLIWARS
jgi:hypothetical protein